MNKFYKNPQRKEKEIVMPYVPNYIVQGIEPHRVGANNPFGIKTRATVVNNPKEEALNNPRLRSLPIMPGLGGISKSTIPYAEVATAMPYKYPSAMTLPNVGNNIENTWNTLDNEIIDDIGLEEIDPKSQMIDNNDYMYGQPKEQYTHSHTQTHAQAYENTSNFTVDLDDNEYILAMNGSIIATGSLKEIENEITKLVFGEHELCAGKQISADDLIVLKKVNIKIGVFIDG